MKRKLTLILIAVLLVTTFFVSCKVEMNDPGEETVTLRFRTDDESRSLSSSRTALKTEDYIWYYTAKKTDGTPASGTKEAETIVGTSGALSEKVTDALSLGNWTFELYGYKTSKSNTNLVYKGNVEDYTLTKDTKTIDITVEPQKPEGGMGTIVVSKDIKLVANKVSYDATDAVIEVVDNNSVKLANYTLNKTFNSSNITFDKLPVGSYKVTVRYISNDVIYAENTIVVNVWNKLETRIEGILDETTINPTFNAKDGTLTGSADITADDSQAAARTFNFSPAAASTDDTSLKTTVTGQFKKTGDKNGTLKVDTYDIVAAKNAETATFTVESGSSAVAAITVTLEDATIINDTTVKIETYISKNLTNVKMYHNNTLMEDEPEETEAAVDVAGEWYYEETSGELVFVTNSFSSFHVTSSINIYDKDNNTAYTLAKKTDNPLEYVVKDSSGEEKATKDLGNNLVLLDCSLSNYVPDEFTSKNWEVVHNSCIEGSDYYHAESTFNFSGGYGTKIEPYLIANKTQFQNITGKYDKYAYYKIGDGVTEIDCSGWTPVKLYGSFDGNGVRLNNIDNQLFKYVGKIPSSEEYTDLSNWDTRAVTIENFEANFNLEGSLDIAAGMTYMVNGNNTTTFKNVTVSGTIIGGSNSGVFFCYTSGNAYRMYPDCQELLDKQKIVLEGCTVSAKLINPNGIIGVIGGYPTFGNKKVTIECDKEMSTLHNNYGDDATNSGKVGYLAVTSFWNENSTVRISNSYLASSGNSFECKSLYRAKPTKGTDNYTVNWNGTGYSSDGKNEKGSYAATRMEVYIAAQLTETNKDGSVIAGGITIGLSHLSTIKKDGTSGDTANVLGVFNTVSLTARQDAYSAKVYSSSLVCTTGGGSDGPNYTYGTIKLQVALFDSDNNMVAYVNEIIAEKEKSTGDWTVVSVE